MAKLKLSSSIESLAGIFVQDNPYIIQRDKEGNFYTRRIHPYGGGFDASHWEYIEFLLQLVDTHVYLADFEVSVEELAEALSEKYACPFLPSQVKKWTQKERLNAAQFREFNAWLKTRGL